MLVTITTTRKYKDRVINMIAEVFYWKDIKWMTEIMFNEGKFPSEEQINNEWVKVAELHLPGRTSLESVWTEMNLHPEDYFIKFSYRKGIKHTSMSVGDIIMVSGKYHIVVSVGFKELEWDRVLDCPISKELENDAITITELHNKYFDEHEDSLCGPPN